MVQRIHFIFVIKVLIYGLGIMLLPFVIVFSSGLSSESNVLRKSMLSLENIDQARKILYEGTKIKPDSLATITLTESDLNLAGNYLLNRYFQSAINIELVNNKVRCEVSLSLPKKFISHYFNLNFRLGSEAGEVLPHIAKFKVGKLLLPAKFAEWVIDFMIRHSFLNEYFILATSPIKQVTIAGKTLTLFYETYSSQPIDIESRPFYQEKIAEIVTQHNTKWRLSLAELLKPVFELAYQRATLETAQQENRNAILALNDYINARPPPIKPPFLYKRIDLAQHFIGSALLTASLNSQVANALGEVKELSDSRAGGSGFSFIDLTADKTGSRFGELAVSSPENARRLQQLMAQINDYQDFMPDPLDLPEHMSEAEFQRKFESTQSLIYLTLAAKIDARIEQIPLYHVPR